MRQALTMAAKPLGLGDHTLSGRGISTVMQRMKSSAQCNSLGYTMVLRTCLMCIPELQAVLSLQ